MQLRNSNLGNIINISILLLLLFILMGFSSCYNVNKNEAQPPSKLLSKSEMVSLLTEIQITEAGFTINKNIKDANSLKPKYYNKILNNCSITSEQFKENVEYYHHSPKVMEEIYEIVLKNLSTIQSDVIIEEEEFDKKRKEDSIAIVNDSLNIALIDSLKIVK